MSSSTTARRLSKSWEDYKPQSAKAKEYDEESGAADHTSIVVKEEEEDPSSSTNARSLDGSGSSVTADEVLSKDDAQKLLYEIYAKVCYADGSVSKEKLLASLSSAGATASSCPI